MFRNIFGGFLVLQLWLYIQHFVLDNFHLWGNSLCIHSYKVFVVELVFQSKFSNCKAYQILHIGGATAASFDGIAVKGLAESVVH